MDIRKYLAKATPEEVERDNKAQIEENNRMFLELKAKYEQGLCIICDQELNSFDSQSPCFHWFLLPRGIKKKHFNDYLSNEFYYHRFESYIRWIANIENPILNINDLASEKNPSKLVEYTVKYLNIELSFSFTPNDLKGHENSLFANFPHFHIQVTRDGKPFIRYNDFHIPFSSEDIEQFDQMNEFGDRIEFSHASGMGMSILEDQNNLNQILEGVSITDNTVNAAIKIHSYIKPADGEKISISNIQNILRESDKTKVPVARLLTKYFPNTTISIEFSRGEGVPNIAKRNTRN